LRTNWTRKTLTAFSGATVTYGYVANSSLVDNIGWQNSGVTRLTVNKSYDYLNRLSTISAAPSGSAALAYAYAYNDANQRVRMALADGSFWVYEYDSLGQVKTGKCYWSDWTPVAGQQFEYTFDDIGNRTSTKAGGDATGQNLRSATYNPTLLNHYSGRGVPGAVDVVGIANAGAAVTVAGQAAYRRGEYFQSPVAVGNSTGPIYTPVTVTAANGGASNSQSGNVLLAGASESFGYDQDGNLTSDGLWIYTWDAENRLATVQSASNVPSAARRQVNFDYDFLGRRIGKTVNTWSGSTWVFQAQTKFIYDGWNLVGEFDASNNFIRSYTWGADLSGSMVGAGGVGGLLGVVSSSGANYFPAYDGIGNVMGYVDGISAQLVAQQEYGPFGENIRATSSLIPAIPIRWSTKYTDLETDSRTPDIARAKMSAFSSC